MSAYLQGRYPEEAVRFENWTEVEAVEGDRDASLARVREQMFDDGPIEAAVFIGGMDGIILIEHAELRQRSARTRLVPIPALGGLARDLFDRQSDLPDAMRFATDFTYWLYTLLDIVPDEARDVGQKS
jgi:hypothetical protein